MRYRGHVAYTIDTRNKKKKKLSFYPDNLNDRDILGTLIGQYIKLGGLSGSDVTLLGS